MNHNPANGASPNQAQINLILSFLETHANTTVRVVLRGGRDLTEIEFDPWDDDSGNAVAFEHSEDFRSVRRLDQTYHFTPTQAACVKALWEAMESGMPQIGQAHLLEKVDSNASKLWSVFRGHPAWKTLIVPGNTKGTYQLAPKQEGRRQ